MPFSSAYLLVSHGSRDPRPQIALEHLAKLVTQKLQRTPIPVGQAARLTPNPFVGTAVLELAPLPLHQQISQFAAQAASAGYESVQIVPLFLLAGVHVMEDIPAEIKIARQQMQVNLDCCIHLGSHQQLWQLLLNPVEPWLTNPQTGKVVIAHGSRRTAGNRVIEQIAAQLDALPAYWSIAPSLEDQITALVKQGQPQIAVLPYFLFEGGITDAIEQTIVRLQQQFPYTQLWLSRPIGATPALADCVIDLIQSRTTA